MSKKVLIMDSSAFMRDYVEEVLAGEKRSVKEIGKNQVMKLAASHIPELIKMVNMLPAPGKSLALAMEVEEVISSKL